MTASMETGTFIQFTVTEKLHDSSLEIQAVQKDFIITAIIIKEHGICTKPYFKKTVTWRRGHQPPSTSLCF